MKDSRQVKVKRWKELTWDELADFPSVLREYDGVFRRTEE